MITVDVQCIYVKKVPQNAGLIFSKKTIFSYLVAATTSPLMVRMIGSLIFANLTVTLLEKAPRFAAL